MNPIVSITKATEMLKMMAISLILMDIIKRKSLFYIRIIKKECNDQSAISIFFTKYMKFFI
jgi:hypothetical protein